MSEAHARKGNRWPNEYLEIAAIVGHTTPTACCLWFRAGEPGAYRVLYFDQEEQTAREWFRHNIRAH